jgi:hypothetical protein
MQQGVPLRAPPPPCKVLHKGKTKLCVWQVQHTGSGGSVVFSQRPYHLLRKSGTTVLQARLFLLWQHVPSQVTATFCEVPQTCLLQISIRTIELHLATRENSFCCAGNLLL